MRVYFSMIKLVKDFPTSNSRPCVEQVNSPLIPSEQLSWNDPPSQCSQLLVGCTEHWDANYWYACRRGFLWLSEMLLRDLQRFTTVSFELEKCWREQLRKSLNLQMSSVSVGLQLCDIRKSNMLKEAAVIYAQTVFTTEKFIKKCTSHLPVLV